MGKKAEKRVLNLREAYDVKVGGEALQRAGKCKQLKGIVHEVLYKDKYNANPKNILAGRTAHLTKSNTAQCKDIVITQNGKVVGHRQLKDVVSKGGIKKLAKQINSGKYKNTKVLGTEETVKKLAGKTKQSVESSGISTETTTRIANKALGKIPTIHNIHVAGKAGGIAGATIGAGVEAISNVADVIDGKKSVEDAMIDVAAAGARGGVTGYASAAAGSVAAGATGSLIAASGIAATSTIGAACVLGAPLVVGFAASCAVGSLVSDLFDSIF